MIRGYLSRFTNKIRKQFREESILITGRINAKVLEEEYTQCGYLFEEPGRPLWREDEEENSRWKREPGARSYGPS